MGILAKKLPGLALSCILIALIGKLEAKDLSLLTFEKLNSYNPLEQKSEDIRYSFYFVHNPIFSLNRDNEWVCRMCKEFPSIDNGLLEVLDSSKNSYDLKISFEFDPNFSWGDGKPINGYDLYFTWQASSKLEHRFLGKHFFNRIQQISVDSNDPRKVTVYLRGKSSLFSDWGEITLLPRHLEKKIWLKHKDHPKSYFNHSHYNTDPFKPGLYSGFYNPVSSSQLKRSRNLQASQAAYEKINLIKPSDYAKTNRKNDFLIPETFPNEHKKILNEAKIEKTYPRKDVWGDSMSFEHITVNLRNPILKDKRIRKALSYGFDKNALISSVYKNFVSPAAHFLSPQYQGFNHNITLYDFDLQKSKKLLDDAEWVIDEATKMRHKMGKPLKISLITNSDPERVATAKFLAASWKEIGVELEVKVQKNSLFWTTIKRKAYDGLIMFAWQLPVDRSYYPLFSSNAVPNIRNQYQGQNISGWINNKVDRILINLKTEFSQSKRAAHLQALQKIFADEVPMIPLFLKNQVASLPKDINNFHISGNQFPSSHFVHEWASQNKKLKLSSKQTTK